MCVSVRDLFTAGSKKIGDYDLTILTSEHYQCRREPLPLARRILFLHLCCSLAIDISKFKRFRLCISPAVCPACRCSLKDICSPESWNWYFLLGWCSTCWHYRRCAKESFKVNSWSICCCCFKDTRTIRKRVATPLFSCALWPPIWDFGHNWECKEFLEACGLNLRSSHSLRKEVSCCTYRTYCPKSSAELSVRCYSDRWMGLPVRKSNWCPGHVYRWLEASIWCDWLVACGFCWCYFYCCWCSHSPYSWVAPHS